MQDSNQIRLHAIVEGRVQGVSFRMFVHQNAISLGLTGWVRNRWDGTVEVVAEGDRPSLDILHSALRKGPPASMVVNVSSKWLHPTAEFNKFRIRTTSF